MGVKMNDNRIHGSCKRCQRTWLLEPKKPKWRGSLKNLKAHERELGRKFNHCYCGQPLYD